MRRGEPRDRRVERRCRAEPGLVLGTTGRSCEIIPGK